MATRTTLNVSLPVELGSFVEGLVVSGRYASASEVVRTALRLLQEHETPATGTGSDVRLVGEGRAS